VVAQRCAYSPHHANDQDHKKYTPAESTTAMTMAMFAAMPGLAVFSFLMCCVVVFSFDLFIHDKTSIVLIRFNELWANFRYHVFPSDFRVVKFC